MKKLFLFITFILSAILSSLANAKYVVINPIDRHILSINMKGEHYATHNPEYFFYKTYDIGLKEPYNFKELLGRLSLSTKMNDDDKFNFIIEHLELYHRHSNDPFVKRKLEKDKNKYIEMFDSAIKKAKQIVDEVEGFILKDVVYDYNQHFEYNFERNELSFPSTYETKITQFLGLYYSDYKFFSEKSINSERNLTCKQLYDGTRCDYYFDLPEDIAERIHNRKATILLDIKFKSLNHDYKQVFTDIFNFNNNQLHVEVEDVEVSIIDSQTHYIKFLKHDPNEALRNMMLNSEYSVLNIDPKDLIMDRKELYRTKLKFRRVPEK